MTAACVVDRATAPLYMSRPSTKLARSVSYSGRHAIVAVILVRYVRSSFASTEPHRT